jgi:hypothetical protein
MPKKTKLPFDFFFLNFNLKFWVNLEFYKKVGGINTILLLLMFKYDGEGN